MNRRQRKKLIASGERCTHLKTYLFTIVCFKKRFWITPERCVACKAYSINKQAERKRRIKNKIQNRAMRYFIKKYVARMTEVPIK